MQCQQPWKKINGAGLTDVIDYQSAFIVRHHGEEGGAILPEEESSDDDEEESSDEDEPTHVNTPEATTRPNNREGKLLMSLNELIK